MTYIYKKDGNLITPKALVNGHWRRSEQGQIASGDNVAYLPGVSQANNEDNSNSRSEMRYGYGAVAILMLVLGALFVTQVRNEDDRYLASMPEPEMIEPQVEKDQEMLNQLRGGERDLQSLGAKTVELKDRLEYEALHPYYVSFNNYDHVIAVELKPDGEPLFISSYQQFFQKYEPFFFSLNVIQKINEEEGEGIITLTFQSNQFLLHIEEDQQGNMISLNVEEIKR